jgi:Leucine-rich repeat (LRR) protein
MPMPRRHPVRLVATILVALASAVALAAADPPDVRAARERIAAIGRAATCVVDPEGRLTEITIPDGSAVTADDVALIGRLSDLVKLRILDCRALDDDMVSSLRGLRGLEVLALTNTGMTDAGALTIAEAFPGLTELDLSSNTNLTGAAMKSIASLVKLERLSLVQTRFNDLQTRRLAKLVKLQALDLRGNMEAGDLTLAVVAGLPRLRGLKHRSTIVSDEGLAALAGSTSLEALLAQDFAITSASGAHLAAIPSLTSLEIFRCQGFGSEGVLALAPLKKLTRLTLRDLPEVGDAALSVLGELPVLERLTLHELASVGDEGLAHVASARSLVALDIWSLPGMTDRSVAAIASLPNLRELSIRETGVSEAAVDTILAMPNLTTLTLKNGALSREAVARLSARKWTKLDLGR